MHEFMDDYRWMVIICGPDMPVLSDRELREEFKGLLRKEKSTQIDK